jgi:predicted nucleotidyltransferase
MSEDVRSTALDAALAAAVASEPGVLAAWLFGSRAGGAEHAGSDVDVAFLLAPGTTREVLSRFSATLSSRLGSEADVVDLASSTPVLGFEIVARGRRVFTRDALAADEAEERCLREYLDTEYMRRVQHHYLYGDPP